MSTQAACERCGLRTVRKELERDGVIVRFCDECYWDESKLESAASSEGRPADQTRIGRQDD